MKFIKIVNCYEIALCMDYKNILRDRVAVCSMNTYGSNDFETVLNRSFRSIVIEFWVHVVAYYLTKPISFISVFKRLNDRARDCDLEEHK